jgi:transcriptional regulator of heat shock response
MTDHAGLARSELIPVFLDQDGQPHPRLAQALLEVSADQVETAHLPTDNMDAEQLRQQVQTLAEKLAADHFSEAQLLHAQNLETERRKVEKYYRQQESAVKQIAIENIRLAKQRELLERRHADLKSLDDRRVLVPDLNLIGMALWHLNEI